MKLILLTVIASKRQFRNRKLGEALGRSGIKFPYINSLKSMIGHCLSAAGSIENVCAVHQGFIFPNIRRLES
jgi:3-oxoacyl-(acyl-carrier-protein) synthase